jgi:putative ABC transport system permease protein
VSLDLWREILDTMSRNRLRAVLTALSVSWGIFMLVILLGTGQGLRNGVEHDFRDDAVNSIWLRPGRTSIPYKGSVPGRNVRFKNGDIDAIVKTTPAVNHITGRFRLWGNYPVSYGSKHAEFEIMGVHADHQYLEKTQILAGRFLNETDVTERRKVACIGPQVRDTLFGSENYLGQFIDIKGVHYKVIGLYQDDGDESELRKIYLPISTAQLVYHGNDRVHQVMFTIGDADVKTSQEIADATSRLMAARHGYSPDDRRAINVQNNLERFQRISQIFDWIRAFVWVVGLGTVFAGIVGVSNIMLISVQERTLEIGIRKAVGATPFSIVSQILLEAVILTAVAGYLGLIAGVGLIELVKKYVPENQYIRNPEVDINVAIIATVLLTFAGAIAGLIPAMRAARVTPVVAMREGAN